MHTMHSGERQDVHCCARKPEQPFTQPGYPSKGLAVPPAPFGGAPPPPSPPPLAAPPEAPPPAAEPPAPPLLTPPLADPPFRLPASPPVEPPPPPSAPPEALAPLPGWPPTAAPPVFPPESADPASHPEPRIEPQAKRTGKIKRIRVSFRGGRSSASLARTAHLYLQGRARPALLVQLKDKQLQYRWYSLTGSSQLTPVSSMSWSVP